MSRVATLSSGVGNSMETRVMEKVAKGDSMAYFSFVTASSPKVPPLQRPFVTEARRKPAIPCIGVSYIQASWNPSWQKPHNKGPFVVPLVLPLKGCCGHPVASSTAFRLLAISNSSISNILRTVRASCSFTKYLCLS